MSIKNVIKSFIKEFYVIKYEPKRNLIIISDTNEGVLGAEPNSILLGNFKSKNVFLIWGNIKEIVGVDYHHKDYISDFTELFSDVYKNKITREFFETLIEANVPVEFSIKEVIEYFPNLNN
jgi:hypothetical protein